MPILLRIPGVLWKISLVWTIISIPLNVIEIQYPPILDLLRLLSLFIFLDVLFYIGMGQILGGLTAKIRYGSKLPSADNYDCKIDYILPFEGKWTTVNGGISKVFSHSWGIIAQRYAYDFIIMDDEGKFFAGDNKNVQNYYCYGKNIIAPADGMVIQVSNNHRDSRVNGKKAYCDTWDIRGNFVVIQHAEKEFSVCAHLIPGSITVRAGDKVEQGDAIGKCGNSGNSSQPHLHFHIQSGKSFLASAGLPVSFVNINAQEKTGYSIRDPRSTQKEVQKAHGDRRVYIGRGLEIENENKHGV